MHMGIRDASNRCISYKKMTVLGATHEKGLDEMG
jgi:hypothetical protein